MSSSFLPSRFCSELCIISYLFTITSYSVITQLSLFWKRWMFVDWICYGLVTVREKNTQLDLHGERRYTGRRSRRKINKPTCIHSKYHQHYHNHHHHYQSVSSFLCNSWLNTPARLLIKMVCYSEWYSFMLYKYTRLVKWKESDPPATHRQGHSSTEAHAQVMPGNMKRLPYTNLSLHLNPWHTSPPIQCLRASISPAWHGSVS